VLLPFFILLLGGVCIGFAAILVRLSHTGPVASAFWRMAIAAPLLWGMVTVFNRESGASATTPTSTWREFAPIAWSGFFFAGDLAVWHFSIMYTTVANATLLANFAPVVVTLLGWLIWRHIPSAGFLVGMVVGLTGAIILIDPGFSGQRGHMIGDGLGLITAFFYAGYMVVLKRARDGRGTLYVMAWSTTISAIMLLPLALFFSVKNGTAFLPDTVEAWWVLLGLAVVTQVAGQTFIAYSAAHLSVALSSTSLLIQPLVATIAAWWMFGERLDAAQLLGGLMLLAGIYWARRNG
jgi:drug/metabolite transporter (DMT)-like permease